MASGEILAVAFCRDFASFAEDVRCFRGFSGIENPLFFKPNTGMLYGDAKESLARLASAVRDA